MTPDSRHAWSALREVFDVAVRLPPEERSAFLDASCAEDSALRAGVERLLAADAEATRQPAFLEESFVAFARIVHARAKQSPQPDYGFAGPLSTSSHDVRSSTQT
ncbi:MAG: hypothetical protein Rubg2KO_30340 [Rubricoccaceae bacterium]